MKAEFFPYELDFKLPGGTSRGVLKTKSTYFLKLSENDKTGWGEIALFRGLSCDDKPDFESKLAWLKHQIEVGESVLELLPSLREWPSIRFGLEQAYLSLEAENPFHLFDTDFIGKQIPITINGLIWMGSYESMLKQIEEKLEQGFNCIKIKIGAINFDEEVSLLKRIRSEFDKNTVELRVDANGAFSMEESMEKLQALAALDVHSIEQPIKARQIDAMRELCVSTPLPIALDEELIGVNQFIDKVELLEDITPQYIILKPSLVGGFESCDEWIEIAESLEIGWWVTSALESNIGLNAIAQYVSSKHITMPQGLGTGSLFTNNIPSPLKVKNAALEYNPSEAWDLTQLR